VEQPTDPKGAASGAMPPRAAGGAREPVEPDAPPTTRIFLQIVVLAVILLVALAGLWQYFGLGVREEVYRKELSLPSRELAEVAARDEGRLTRYDVISAPQGQYQIPIKRAMQLLVDNPSLLEPVPLPSSRPAAPGGEGTR
jgi:hypothetical protein